MPRISSKPSVKIDIEGQSDSETDEVEKKTRERRGGKIKRQEKPNEIEVCSCPTCQRMFMRTKNEQAYDEEEDEGDYDSQAESDGSDDYERTARALRAEFLRDQKKKLEEEKSKIEKEQVERAEFILRKPRVVCLDKADTWLQLSVEALEEGSKSPSDATLDRSTPSNFPKGILFEIQVQPATQEGGRKAEWATTTMPKNSTYAIAHKLQPSCEYKCRSRLGLAAQFTWAGSPEWKPYGEVGVFKTSEPSISLPSPTGQDSSIQSASQPPKEAKAQGGEGKRKDAKARTVESSDANEDSGDEGYTQTESGQYYCRACKLTLASWQAWERHVVGVKHQRRLVKNQREEEEGDSNQASPKVEEKVIVPPTAPPVDNRGAHAYASMDDFNCKLCGVKCNGPRTFEDHLISKRHRSQSKANGQGPPTQVPQEALAPAPPVAPVATPALNLIVKASPNVILVRRDVTTKPQPPQPARPTKSSAAQDSPTYEDEHLESNGDRDRQNGERPPRKLCQCFIRGTCHFGSRCWHIHDNDARSQHLKELKAELKESGMKDLSLGNPKMAQGQGSVKQPKVVHMEEALAPAPAPASARQPDYQPAPALTIRPSAYQPVLHNVDEVVTVKGMREPQMMHPPPQDLHMTPSWQHQQQQQPLQGANRDHYWPMPVPDVSWHPLSLAPEPKALLSLSGGGGGGGESFFGSQMSSHAPMGTSAHNPWAQAGGIGSGIPGTSYMSSFMNLLTPDASATVQLQGPPQTMAPLHPQPYQPLGRTQAYMSGARMPVPIPQTLFNP